MLTPVYTKQFERDVKRMKKHGNSLEKLKKNHPFIAESGAT